MTTGMAGIRAIWARILCSLAVLASLAQPAFAETVADVTARISTGAQLLQVAGKLIAADRIDDARALVGAWHKGDKTHRYRLLFTEGLIARKQGDHQRSVDIFRQILVAEPGFTQVRRELAFSLYLAGDKDGARHQADLLVKAGIDDGQNGLRSLIRVIDDSRPFQMRFFASLAPSSNANQGTGSEIIWLGGLPFAIPAEQQKKAGIGLIFGTEMVYRQKFTNTAAFTASMTAQTTLNPFEDSALASLDGGVGIEKRFGDHALRVSAVGRIDLADEGGFYWEAGAAAEAIFKTGAKDRTRLAGRLVHHETKDTDAFDGWKFRADIQHDHMLAPTRFVRAIAAYETDRINLARESYDEYMAGIGAYNEFSGGYSVYGQVSGARRIYRAPAFVFGTRKDWRYEAKATLTKRDFLIMGLAPQFTYTYTRNDSSDPFEKWDAHGFDVKLTKEF